MGWVEYISPKEKTVHIQFDDGKECDYLFNELEEIVHSYAITIHIIYRNIKSKEKANINRL